MNTVAPGGCDSTVTRCSVPYRIVAHAGRARITASNVTAGVLAAGLKEMASAELAMLGAQSNWEVQ